MKFFMQTLSAIQMLGGVVFWITGSTEQTVVCFLAGIWFIIASKDV